MEKLLYDPFPGTMAIEVSNPEARQRSVADGGEQPALEAGDSDISMLDVLVVLAARKRLILFVTLGSAVIAAIVALLLPNQYTSTCVILPPQQNSSLASAMLGQLSNFASMANLSTSGSLGLKNPNDLLVAMMKSRTVEDAMIQHYGLMQEFHDHHLSDARKDLEKHVSIDGNDKSGLIRVAVYDRDPNRAAQLANGYVEQFHDLSEHLAITEASQRRLFFEQQLEAAKNKLADAEESLKKTELQTGLIQPESQSRALIESAAVLRAQIQAKEVEISSLETFATNQNAQLIQAQQELARLRGELQKLGQSEDGLDPSLIVPRGKVPEAGLEYLRKMRDVKYYETIFDILARQFEVAKLDEAKEGAIIQVVDKAIPADRRSSPKRTLIVLVATIFGFVISIFVVLIQAGVRRIKESPESAQKLDSIKQSLLKSSRAAAS